MKNFIVCIVTMFAFSHLIYPAQASKRMVNSKQRNIRTTLGTRQAYFIKLLKRIREHKVTKMKTAQKKHIFAQFATQKFGDEIENFLIKTVSGREFLVKNRAIVRGVECATSMLIKGCEHVVAPLYNPDGKTTLCQIIYTPKKPTSHKTNNLCAIASKIVAIEKVLIENDDLSSLDQKAFESTRVDYLYLLTTILKQDNSPYVKAADPYSLPELFEKTHASWPPQKYHSIVHPASGYEVIKEALEHRKAHKIDDIDMSQYTENWNVTTSYGLNSEEKKS